MLSLEFILRAFFQTLQHEKLDSVWKDNKISHFTYTQFFWAFWWHKLIFCHLSPFYVDMGDITNVHIKITIHGVGCWFFCTVYRNDFLSTHVELSTSRYYYPDWSRTLYWQRWQPVNYIKIGSNVALLRYTTVHSMCQRVLIMNCN